MTPDQLRELTHGRLMAEAKRRGFSFRWSDEYDCGIYEPSRRCFSRTNEPHFAPLLDELKRRWDAFEAYLFLVVSARRPVPTAGYDGRLLWSDGLPPRPTEPTLHTVEVPPPPPPPAGYAFYGFAVMNGTGSDVWATTSLADAVRVWVETGTKTATITAFVRHPSGIELWSMYSPDRGWDERYVFA